MSGLVSNIAQSARVETVAASTSAQVWSVPQLPIPGTLWVRPGAGNTFTVEYSTDNGSNYNSLVGLTGATAYSEVRVNSGFTHIKITPAGTQGGTWGVC